MIQALSLGALNSVDLADFAAGLPSQVDELLDNPERALQSFGTDFTRTPSSTAWLSGGPLEAVADEDAAQFLVESGVARLLDEAFCDPVQASATASQLASGPYTERVRERFTSLLAQAEALPLPPGWSFAPAGVPSEPNLMQRVIAVRVRDERRIGNWSGTGAGKTVSALLASRVVNADITVITCPNSVVDTWVRAITSTFPNCWVAAKTLAVPLPGVPSYIVVNYEHLQRSAAPAELAALAASGRVDMVVIDEIHQAKQRDEHKSSLRRENLSGFLDDATAANPHVCVLGMSATPVINTLTEGASLLHLITGSDPKLSTAPTIANCMKLHQQLVCHGLRFLPKYETTLAYREVPVDCTEELDDLMKLTPEDGMLSLERILTRARLRAIREEIRPKTLLYTHLRTGITEQLADALTSDGWRVGYFTGVDKSGLDGFVNGDIDVLIATSSISTGVDGLQHVCNRVVVNVLPWTDAEYTQLKGRVWRQGQSAEVVDFVVPVTHAQVNGEEWSWCRAKLDRLKYKRSVADAAVDGMIPDEHLRSPEQAARDSLAWLERLSAGLR